MTKHNRISRKKWRSRLAHFSLTLFTLLVFAAAVLLIGLFTVFNGPSQTMSDIVVRSVTETSALKFIPWLFMSPGDVESSLARTSSASDIAVSDTGLYDFSSRRGASVTADTQYAEYTGTGSIAVSERKQYDTVAADDAQAVAPREDPYGVGEGIEIIRIVNASYKGYLAIIDDPGRVSVGISSDFRSGLPGLYIHEFAEKYGAVLTVNGGAFEDLNGTGSGGVPGGLLISGGVLYHGATSGVTVAGFDANDRLIVGNLSTKEAQALGLRDAVAYGPALIVNGKPNAAATKNPGRNPRTAIGQRADGAVLLLVLDGRKIDSIGASMSDLIDIMTEYGAINACNLDGGSSSVMYASGVQLTDGMTVIGTRRIPTAIIVK